MEQIVELSDSLTRGLWRPYHRRFMAELRAASRLTLVTGKRGVGKTTCLVQLCVEQAARAGGVPGALYLPMDHVRLRGVSMYDVAEWFVGRGGELLCVDETHTAPDWAAQLKSIHDSFPSLRLVASGSSAIRLEAAGRDLSRRLLVHRLPELSFREHLELGHGCTLEPVTLEEVTSDPAARARAVVDDLHARGQKVLACFDEFVRVGAYPFHREFHDRELFYRAVGQTVRTAIDVDLLAAHPQLSGASVRAMQKLLSFLSASVPFTPDMRKLKGILGIGDERTLKTYLGYLAEAGVLLLLMPSDRKLAGLEKPDRIYLGDTVQLFAAAGDRADRGTVRETFFLQSLLPVHRVVAPGQGDFLVDGHLRVEVGGRSKTRRQTAADHHAVLAVDDIETGAGGRVPLWLFGFLR